MRVAIDLYPVCMYHTCIYSEKTLRQIGPNRGDAESKDQNPAQQVSWVGVGGPSNIQYTVTVIIPTFTVYPVYPVYPAQSSASGISGPNFFLTHTSRPPDRPPITASTEYYAIFPHRPRRRPHAVAPPPLRGRHPGQAHAARPPRVPPRHAQRPRHGSPRASP